jgi:hypothetical protein
MISLWFILASSNASVVLRGIKNSLPLLLFEGWGLNFATWDGKDGLGRQVASGVYLVRMAAGKFRQVRKMVLLK